MNPIAASALTLSLLAGEVQANEKPRVSVTPNGSQPSAKWPGGLVHRHCARRCAVQRALMKRGSVARR
jgi:hypothetical protein